MNGGVSGGAFASCFGVASGAACGAVSATLVTVVDQMYEVSVVVCVRHIAKSRKFECSCSLILPRFTLTSSLRLL